MVPPVRFTLYFTLLIAAVCTITATYTPMPTATTESAASGLADKAVAYPAWPSENPEADELRKKVARLKKLLAAANAHIDTFGDQLAMRDARIAELSRREPAE